MSRHSTAVVLGGGGLAGIGWTTGVLAALEEQEVLRLGSADRAYSSRRNRRYLRRRQVKHTIPERRSQQANRWRRGGRGGRPGGFDHERYARRNEVERTIPALKGFRAVATRYETQAYVFHGTIPPRQSVPSRPRQHAPPRELPVHVATA
ncbi:transposase [Streptomyces sp. CBMA152]|uniref:transposase n=1 Tax=Streptomyces sp. CBMA152 TaxID=1896312 RepID=UPI0037D9C9D6